MNLNQSPAQLITNLINAGNPGRNFTIDRLKFSNLLPMPKGSERNTQLDVTVDDEKTTTVYYDRLDLGSVVGQIELPYTDQGVVGDLLDAVNAQFGTRVTTDDILNVEIPAPESFPAHVLVRAHQQSLIWLGQFNVTLTGENEAPAPEPDPTPSTFAIRAVADTEIAEAGDVVTYAVSFDIDDAPNTEAYMCNITMTGQTFEGQSGVSEGMTLMGQNGDSTAQVVMVPGQAVGTYTANIETLIDGEVNPATFSYTVTAGGVEIEAGSIEITVQVGEGDAE